MEYTIVTSSRDPAGINIYNALLSKFKITSCKGSDYESKGINPHDKSFDKPLKLSENIEIIKIKEDTLNCEGIEKKINGKIIIFATRHSSQQGNPCFCVHTPGNWGKADYGGQSKALCISPASLQRQFYLKLTKNNTLPYTVTMEATHHGPLINEKPCLFIEIGSTQKEWDDLKACEILANTILEVTSEPIEIKKVVIGIGGPHYCDNFSKLLHRTDYGIGHVCPKHMLGDFDEEMAQLAVDRTYENKPIFVLDWKGLGQYKQQIKNVLTSKSHEFYKIKDLIKDQ